MWIGKLEKGDHSIERCFFHEQQVAVKIGIKIEIL